MNILKIIYFISISSYDRFSFAEIHYTLNQSYVVKHNQVRNHWLSICPSLSVLLACFYVHLRIFGWYGNVNITSDVLKRQANFSHVWCYKRTSMFAFLSNKQFQLCRLYERAIGIAFSLGTVSPLFGRQTYPYPSIGNMCG